MAAKSRRRAIKVFGIKMTLGCETDQKNMGSSAVVVRYDRRHGNPSKIKSAGSALAVAPGENTLTIAIQKWLWSKPVATRPVKAVLICWTTNLGSTGIYVVRWG
jgi:hypothetical protein